MNTRYVMGIDAGTESIRAVLYDLCGRQVAQASRLNHTAFPQPGWAEQSPAEWIENLTQAVRECMARAEGVRAVDVAGLCVDGTCSTVVAATNDGGVLGDAILWMDTRAGREVEVIARTNHPVLRYSGGADAVEWLVPKALWMKNHEPERYRRAQKLVEALDYLTFWLSGEWSASVCNATDAWNYVSVEGGFCPAFFEQIGLPDLMEKLPSRVKQMGERAGALTAEAARALGLLEGTPVAQGGIDAHAGMLGMGIGEPGVMAMTIGSSSVHLVYTEQPTFLPGVWGPYPDIILKDKWLLQGGQTSTGSVVRWVKDGFAPAAQEAARQSGRKVYQILDERAAAIPPGANGVTALEHFQGNRSPYRDPLAKGAFLGLTLATREEELFRAAMEAAAYGTRLILETLRVGGVAVTELRACGGGTKSALWLQIHADVCGLPLTVCETENVAALGSAMCAAVAAGLYPDLQAAMRGMAGAEKTIRPDDTAHRRYTLPYRRYVRAYQALKPLFHEQEGEEANEGKATDC